MIRSTTQSPHNKVLGLGDYYLGLAERIRGLRTSAGDMVQTLGVTSCLPGEGVSSVALNLAAAAGEIFQSPILAIEANFQQPVFETSLSLQEDVGLADFLNGAAEQSEVIREAAMVNLSLVTGGTTVNRLRTNCDPSRIQGMLTSLKSQFALVVVDMPAALASSTCWNIAPTLDGVLLVVEANRVESEAAVRVKKRLTEAGANLVGVVLNKQSKTRPSIR